MVDNSNLGCYECLNCTNIVSVCGCRWCVACYYPGIDEDYNEFRDLVEEGHSRTQAAVLSGWKGSEEVTNDK